MPTKFNKTTSRETQRIPIEMVQMSKAHTPHTERKITLESFS